MALFLGAGLARRSTDTHFPFRQDSDFHYLTGFDHPNAAAVLRTDGGPPFTLFVEPRDRAAETWTGYRPGVEGAVADFGADAAHPHTELLDKLPVAARAGEARLPRARPRRARRRQVHARSSRRRAALAHRRGAARGDRRSARDRPRAAPVQGARGARRDAARRGDQPRGPRSRRALAREGVYEYELAAVLDYTFRRRGGAGPAYETIVGGGANATILHYVSQRPAAARRRAAC